MLFLISDISDIKSKVKGYEKKIKKVADYKNMKLIGAVAGANIVGESDTYAMKRGLYVLAQSGENVTLLNDEHFEATIF